VINGFVIRSAEEFSGNSRRSGALRELARSIPVHAEKTER